MIEIEIAVGRDGTDTASCEIDGKRYEASSRSGALCELARQLRAAGLADGPWSAWRGDLRCLSGASWRALADLRVSEDAVRGPRFRPWLPKGA